MADLKPPEVEKVKLSFDIYDTTGEGKLDAFYLGDLLRSLDLRPSQALVEKNGGKTKKGEKLLTIEEILPIYSQVKKDKDVGALADFLEGFKVYDKHENGTLMAGELVHILQNMGEKLTDQEAESIVAETGGAEDEDGYIKYEPFLKVLCAGPFPEGAETKA